MHLELEPERPSLFRIGRRRIDETAADPDPSCVRHNEQIIQHDHGTERERREIPVKLRKAEYAVIAGRGRVEGGQEND